MLPTTPPNLTALGTILGTFQYMAPEQLEGQEADARTDIFAFGAVLYEMLTGKKAFEGKTHASLIGAIMHAEPAPMSAIQPLAPPTLDRVVRNASPKIPKHVGTARTIFMTSCSGWPRARYGVRKSRAQRKPLGNWARPCRLLPPA